MVYSLFFFHIPLIILFLELAPTILFAFKKMGTTMQNTQQVIVSQSHVRPRG